ncbi:MAG: 23S rRNA (pseudouridine(1915)-N(3))-methyltransferase RlmH [Flavobacteriaceae bacterium]|nr:23S rRNA (pseudouridine(1915)-N(3))-methyltransferase RlmH [Flavobacteriaceae bacterium]
MKIKLLVIGKTDDENLGALIDMYTKRLKHYIPFEIQVIPDIRAAKNLTTEQQKEREGEVILNALESPDMLILMDENGQQFGSVEFAHYLQKKMNSGIKLMVLAVGGPFGFSKAVYERAQGKISLSKMTFSHQMVRLFIAEQLYRAFTILNNEPYHHE